MTSFEKFSQLHTGVSPLILGNIWDVNSAQIFESCGYKAIGTSSQAVARSFGYEDGEKLPFDVLFTIAQRVTKVVDIPFTVDLEGGYSRTVDGINENINKLHDAGVVGINIEDTIARASREFQPVEDFKNTLSSIVNFINRNNLKIFINVRTDGFLLGRANAVVETLTRIRQYEQCGVNGIFVPCITNEHDIREVVKVTSLPVNVMCMPELPDFDKLKALGVKRISMGPFMQSRVNEAATEVAKTVLTQNNFSTLFN